MGLSVDYLVRLEQGRSVNPSPETLGALARGLRLTIDERDMLYAIAGTAAPGPGTMPDHVPPGVQRMVDRLADTPVAVFSAIWTVIQWNAMWAALQGDPSGWQGKNRNLVWRHFAGDGSRVRHSAEDMKAHEHGLVADLRAASIRYPDDRELKALLSGLRSESPAFESIWNRFEAPGDLSSRKTVVHPLIGEITLDCEILTVVGADLRIMVLTTASDTRDAANLELLRVIRTQDLSAADA